MEDPEENRTEGDIVLTDPTTGEEYRPEPGPGIDEMDLEDREED